MKNNIIYLELSFDIILETLGLLS